MKKITLLFYGLMFFLGCSSKKSFTPADHLSPKQHDEFMTLIIRYISDLPKGAAHDEKFSKEHDQHYLEQQSIHRLDAYYPSDDGTIFFMVSRRAPSITDKRVAIAGRLKFDDSKKVIVEFEEVFRTWKMAPDILAQRASYLFELMVKGGDLERYQINKTSEEWIEFPDARVYYDKNARQWKLR